MLIDFSVGSTADGEEVETATCVAALTRHMREYDSSMKIICETCGEVDHLRFDGYGFGDRLLEGVMFEARMSGDGNVNVKVQLSDREYFNDLAAATWLAKAGDYVRHLDIATCPKCGGDLEVPWNVESEEDAGFGGRANRVALDNLYSFKDALKKHRKEQE